MRIVMTDPMSGYDIINIEETPFAAEGTGERTLRIYFK